MKKNDQELLHSRRTFLRQSACATLGISGVVNTLSHLTLMNAALAQASLPEDYRALVVLFLFGGNDSNNMLIPAFEHPSYGDYTAGRRALAIFDPADARSGAQVSIPLNGGGQKYAVHPSMQPVAELFNAGRLAFVANVGTLAYPFANQAAYISNPLKRPPQLFSHSDQQIQWQSSVPDKPFLNGWGGRVADFLASKQPGNRKVSMSISLSGINSLQMGNQVTQYAVGTEGAVSLRGYSGLSGTSPYAGAHDGAAYKNNKDGKRLEAFNRIVNYAHEDLLQEGYNEVVRRAQFNEGLIGDALVEAGKRNVNFDSIFSTAQSSLGNQLKMIARLVAGRSAIGNNRQIFFCSAGGYDTHQDQRNAHDTLMKELAASLAAFDKAMTTLGDNDKVLTVTHSDFSRTFSPNGDDSAAGSDHGWGGHQIVMGGRVEGGQIFGTFPSLIVGADQDVDRDRGRGRWIPTTSVDQYAAAAARWLGIPDNEMGVIFPNLNRFSEQLHLIRSA